MRSTPAITPLQLGLLYPAAFLAHLWEEYAGGEGFVSMARELVGIETNAGRWLLFNAFFFLILVILMIIYARRSVFHWVFATLATIALINGVAHLLITLGQSAYTPGVISGMVLYLPLGLITLRTLNRQRPPVNLQKGIWVGVGLHLLIPVAFWGFNSL